MGRVISGTTQLPTGTPAPATQGATGPIIQRVNIPGPTGPTGPDGSKGDTGPGPDQAFTWTHLTSNAPINIFTLSPVLATSECLNISAMVVMAKNPSSSGFSAVWSRHFFGIQNVSGTLTDPLGGTTDADSIPPVLGSGMAGATAKIIISGTDVAVQVQRPTGVDCFAGVLVDFVRGIPTLISEVLGISPSTVPHVVASPTTLTVTLSVGGTGTTAITVDGISLTSVMVVNDTTVTGVLPAGTYSIGTGNVVVTSPSSPLSLVNGFTFSSVGSPTVSLVTPNVGSAAGGNTINLIGTDYISGATVTINGVSCTSVVVNSSTSITCVTPAWSTPNGTDVAQIVTVTTTNGSGSGSTIPSKFFYYPSNTAYNLHTRGDVGMTVAGGNVTNWADQSGSGNTWTASSNWPTPTTLNGLAAINCSSAGSQGMTIASPNGIADNTTFFVFNQTSETSGFDTIWYVNGVSFYGYIEISTPGPHLEIVNGGSGVTDTNVVVPGTTYCGRMTSAVAGAVQLEPNTATTGTLSSTGAVTSILLGQNGLGGSFGFNGVIGEVLSYPTSTLSPGDIVTIYSIMQQNWSTA